MYDDANILLNYLLQFLICLIAHHHDMQDHELFSRIGSKHVTEVHIKIYYTNHVFIKIYKIKANCKSCSFH